MLAQRQDLNQLQARYQSQGRVLIPNMLEAGFADRLLTRAQQWAEWHLVTRIAGSHREFDAAQMEQLPEPRKAVFRQLVEDEARSGFQYLYERYPLYERARQRQLSDAVFIQAYELLRSEGFLHFLRRVTGCVDISFTDGQLSRYRAGHFLTMHDDSSSDLGRSAAVVLNLTPNWSVDHGGLLQFVDQQGQVETAFTPRFNALSLFRVPAVHSVSLVPPYVDGSRFALTGWARTGIETPADLAA